MVWYRPGSPVVVRIITIVQFLVENDFSLTLEKWQRNAQLWCLNKRYGSIASIDGQKQGVQRPAIERNVNEALVVLAALVICASTRTLFRLTGAMFDASSWEWNRE